MAQGHLTQNDVNLRLSKVNCFPQTLVRLPISFFSNYSNSKILSTCISYSSLGIPKHYRALHIKVTS